MSRKEPRRSMRPRVWTIRTPPCATWSRITEPRRLHSNGVRAERYNLLEAVALLGLLVGRVEHRLTLSGKTLVDLIEVVTHVSSFRFRDAAPVRVARMFRRAIVDLPVLSPSSALRTFGGLRRGNFGGVGFLQEWLKGLFEPLAVGLGQVQLPSDSIPPKLNRLSAVTAVQVVGVNDRACH